MIEKKSKRHLLMTLLAPLLREWGYEMVLQCLAEVNAEQTKGSPSHTGNKQKPEKKYHRPSATETIERLGVAMAQKDSLRLLASRFDAKTFLPTSSDVRLFLDMRGHDPGPIKQRNDSFRKVLDVLFNMADDELKLLCESGAHAGPTQLGPLSDAIKATNSALRTVESQGEKIFTEESIEQRIGPTDDES